jgi:hypothetical protein
MRFTACCATRNAPNAVTASDFSTSSGVELHERPAGAVAGVVDHDFGRAHGGVEIVEQLLHLVALGGVAGEGLGLGLDREVVQIVGGARRQRDLDAFLAQDARQRGGEAGAGADDEGGVEAGLGHCGLVAFLLRMCNLSSAHSRASGNPGF